MIGIDKLKGLKLTAGMVAACVGLLVLVGAAFAFAEGPRWLLTTDSVPRNLPPGGEGQIVVIATDAGNGPVRVLPPSTPVDLTVHLPAGLTATGLRRKPSVGNEDNFRLKNPTKTVNSPITV